MLQVPRQLDDLRQSGPYMPLAEKSAANFPDFCHIVACVQGKRRGTYRPARKSDFLRPIFQRAA
jgi:hypothetical protein